MTAGGQLTPPSVIPPFSEADPRGWAEARIPRFIGRSAWGLRSSRNGTTAGSAGVLPFRPLGIDGNGTITETRMPPLQRGSWATPSFEARSRAALDVVAVAALSLVGNSALTSAMTSDSRAEHAPRVLRRETVVLCSRLCLVGRA